MNLLKPFLILSLALSMGVKAGAQTFYTASDTVAGSYYQCKGGLAYSGLSDYIWSIPSGQYVYVNWHVVASNFPADWLPGLVIKDTITTWYNTVLEVWDGTTGPLITSSYPFLDHSPFALSLPAYGLTTYGTYYMEINLQDAYSSYNKNIVFVLTRDNIAAADSIQGVNQLCIGQAVTYLSATSPSYWYASSTHHASINSSGLAHGMTAGPDTIALRSSIIVHSGSDSCAFDYRAFKPVTVNALPVPVVTGFGGTLFTSSAYTAFQWLAGTTPVLGANNYYFNPPADGSYSVIVTDVNGCTDTSAAVFDAKVGTSQVANAAAGIRIYPNPASDYLYIDAPFRVNATLTGIGGQVVAEIRNTSSVDLTGLAPGAYLLTVRDAAYGTVQTTEMISKR